MRTHSNPRPLAGCWKFKTDPEGRGDFQEPDSSIESWQRQVTYFDLEHDDSAWDEIAVPACWQTAGYRYNGIAWYRTRFDYTPDGANNVVRLHFKGVDYFADVWLNGYYLGSHEGFFHRFAFDASRWIRHGENLLTVKVDAPNLKRVLVKGALQGINWDCNDPTLDPGGIWNDVQLLASRDLYLEDLKVTPYLDLEGNSARILCRVTICNPTGEIKEVSVGTTLSPHNFTGESHTASAAVIVPPGVSQADLWLNVVEPRLWWPWDMGAQNLYDVAVSVTDEAGELDRLGDRIGLRHLRREEDGWACYLNGKRIFCRGPNYVSEQLQSTMTRARYEFDVQLMKDANMNMVRSYCVVEREEFYDVCDEKGVMVYQDFPTTGRMSNRGDFLRRAVQQGRRMVNQLYHHPSIVLWSWGSQPGIKNFEKLCLALATACAEEDPHRFIQQGASVWQWRTAKDKFDWPIDFHLLPGWFHPDDRFGPFLMMERDECASGYSVEELKIKRKELLEFVSEYGPPEALPELPSLEKIIPEADRWPPNWDTYARHCLHGDILRRWIGEPTSLEQLIGDSQEHQAFHLKYHTEFYRRHKFRPCNGALFFQFKDCWPAVTAAVVDYYGRRKRAYYTLQQAFNPIHVLMDWPPLAGEAPGTQFRKDLFVVNDFHHPYPALQITWQIRDASGSTLLEHEVSCSVAANSLTKAAEVAWTIPQAPDARYRITFELADATGTLSSNEYRIAVQGPSPISPWRGWVPSPDSPAPGAEASDTRSAT